MSKNISQYFQRSYLIIHPLLVGSMEAPSKAFLLFFLLPDWLKLNHVKSRMEAASFGAKNVQKTTFEAAEMMLGGPWIQQYHITEFAD